MSFISRWLHAPATGAASRAAAAASVSVADAYEDADDGARYGGTRKGCSHICSLSAAMPCCCMCADKRPMRMSYEAYVDGKGVTRSASREAHYCMECKAAYQRRERGEPEARPAAAARPPRSRAAAAPRSVTVEEYRDMSMKPCGHACSLSATLACCACVDARPMAPDGKYENYSDGRGVTRTAARHDYYCARCKTGVARGDRGLTVAGAAPPAAAAGTKRCTHACTRIGPVCCRCGDTRVPVDGLYWTPVPGRGVVLMPQEEAFCTSCRGRAAAPAAAPRAAAPAGASSMAARAAAAAATVAAAAPASPALARNVSVSSPEPCPLCAHNKLFSVRGFTCSAICKYCNSVFPPDAFPRDFVAALPVMPDDDALRIVARLEQLALENSALRAERQRSGDAMRALDVALAAAPAVDAPVVAAAAAVAVTTGGAAAVAVSIDAAPSAGPEPLSVRSVLSQLCCTVCLDVYTDPVTLPTCGHTFCRACIIGVAACSSRSGAAARGRDAVACPICRTVTGDVSKVAISTELAFVVQAMSDLLRGQTAASAGAAAATAVAAAAESAL